MGPRPPSLPQPRLLTKTQRLNETYLRALAVTSTCTSTLCQLPVYLMDIWGHSQHFRKQGNSHGQADTDRQLSTAKMQPETTQGANERGPSCHFLPTRPNHFPLTRGNAHHRKWWASATMTHVGSPQRKLLHIRSHVSGSSHLECSRP